MVTVTDSFGYLIEITIRISCGPELRDFYARLVRRRTLGTRGIHALHDVVVAGPALHRAVSVNRDDIQAGVQSRIRGAPRKSSIHVIPNSWSRRGWGVPTQFDLMRCSCPGQGNRFGGSVAYDGQLATECPGKDWKELHL